MSEEIKKETENVELNAEDLNEVAGGGGFCAWVECPVCREGYGTNEGHVCPKGYHVEPQDWNLYDAWRRKVELYRSK